MKTGYGYLITGICLACFVLTTRAQTGEKMVAVIAYADPATVKVNRPFNLVYVVKGVAKADTVLLRLDDFETLATSHAAGVENGNPHDTITYRLKPLYEGTFTIPRAVLLIDSEEYKTPPVNITVVEGGMAESDEELAWRGNINDTATAPLQLAFKAPAGVYKVRKGKPFIIPYTIVFKDSKTYSAADKIELSSFPQGKNVSVLGIHSTNTSIQFINGKMSAEKTFNVQMLAKGKGQIKLSAAIIAVGDDRVQSPEAFILVK